MKSHFDILFFIISYVARLIFLLVFIVKIILIGLWSFLIPGFVSVNILMTLIVGEHLWPLQMLSLYI